MRTRLHTRALVLLSSLTALLFLAAPVGSTPGAWSSTPTMFSGHNDAAVALLADGRVLIAGGQSAGNPAVIATAELYDPATGTWSLTGAMTTPRGFASAIALANGKVLVAGGYTPGASASAELYDPSTGTWSHTGSMTTARAAYTATLLPSGKVLVAGGATASGEPTASAEVFDPVSGTWSPAGAMSAPRYWASAVGLADGRVLVVGGFGSGGYRLSSADVYDPATGAWRSAGTMNAPRVPASATLLPSGRVLVAGGQLGDGTLLSSAELYDPSARTWTATGAMNEGRGGHAATLLPSGDVLVAGGSYSGSTELYHPSTGTWSTTGSLATPRALYGGSGSSVAPLLPSGAVLVAGGMTFSGDPLGSAELYEPVGAPSDTTAPVLTPPQPPVVAEATGPDGAAVDFTVAVTDPDDAPGPAICSPASGSTFPLGATSVSCESTDTHGNTGTVSFEVTVVDTTPPVLTVPADIEVDATSPAGADVMFSASAYDLVDDGAVDVTCWPSVILFPIGTTQVVCTASDRHANLAAAAFTVTVRSESASSMLAALISDVSGLNMKSGAASFVAQLTAVQASLGVKTEACGSLKAFTNHVRAQAGKQLTAAQASSLLAEAARIAGVLGC